MSVCLADSRVNHSGGQPKTFQRPPRPASVPKRPPGGRRLAKPVGRLTGRRTTALDGATTPAFDRAADHSIQEERRRTDKRLARMPDSGAASVEVTLAMPLLGLLLLLIVQFAFWAHATHIAQAAANQGVQTARAYGSTADAGIEDTNAILDQTAGSILVDREVTAFNADTSSTVTVTGKAATVVPGLSMPITVSVTAPRELVPGTP